jgi:transposase
MFAEAALDQKLGTLLRMHEEAFRQLGGVPDEILYDRMKTVVVQDGRTRRGRVYWGFGRDYVGPTERRQRLALHIAPASAHSCAVADLAAR